MHTLTAALAIVVPVTLAQASGFSLVGEHGGQSWSAPDGRSIALLGLDDTPTGTLITADDVFAMAVSGNLIALYNGGAANVEYATGDDIFFNGVDPFTALTFIGYDPDDTRAFGAIFALYQGPTTLANPHGGTVTLSADGQLGAFPFPIVPAPGAACLIILGSAGAIRARRARAG